MIQRVAEAVVNKRFVHANGTTSHFHVRDGAVLLTSVHPEHLGNPGELSLEELLRVWEAVTAEAKAEGLIP